MTETTPKHDPLVFLRQEKCKCPECIRREYEKLLNRELKGNIFHVKN